MSKKPVTDVRMAFAWTCDNCGRDNFTEGIAASREIAMTLLKLKYGMGPDEDLPEQLVNNSRAMRPPDEVKCKFCEAEYETGSSTVGYDDVLTDDGDET